MSSSQRARIIVPQEDDLSAANILRLVQPKAYLGALAKVCAPFNSESVEEGIEFVRLLSNTNVRPRASRLVVEGRCVQMGRSRDGRNCTNVGKGAPDVPPVGF